LKIQRPRRAGRGIMAKTILIIDDEIHILEYLKNVFEDNGYQTVTAQNGKAGLEALKTYKPDLITLDLQMPREGGTDFFRKFRSDQELKGIPILVVTGQDDPHRSLKPDKVTAIVQKPFDPQELIRLVKESIGEP
jgi:DNA-binding response OmpR family regulator